MVIDTKEMKPCQNRACYNFDKNPKSNCSLGFPFLPLRGQGLCHAYDNFEDLIKLSKRLMALADLVTKEPHFITNGVAIVKDHIDTIKKFNLI